MTEEVGKLMETVTNIDGYENSAELGDRQANQEPFLPVIHQEGDMVSFLYPRVQQASAHQIHLGFQFAVGKSEFSTYNRLFLRITFRVSVEQIAHGERKIAHGALVEERKGKSPSGSPPAIRAGPLRDGLWVGRQVLHDSLQVAGFSIR